MMYGLRLWSQAANTPRMTDQTAQTNTLPVAGADKVTLNDSGNNDRRIELLDNTDTPAFAVWQRGTLYTKDTI